MSNRGGVPGKGEKVEIVLHIKIDKECYASVCEMTESFPLE